MSSGVAVGRSGSVGLAAAFRAAKANPLLVNSALAVAVAWALIAVLGPVIAPHDPLETTSGILLSPNSTHPFGTDELGRDELSRVLWGARVSIPYSFLIVALSLAVGSIIGGIAGYFGGWVDGGLMRITDLVFAFPAIILAMAIAAVLGPSLRTAVIAVVLVAWPNYARVVRSLVLNAMHSDFLLTARLLGTPSVLALARDVLPNVVGPLVVYSALALGDAMLILAGLSFLGLGSQPPTAEWGSMISDAAQYYERWWLAVFPGLAIVTLVLALNILGDRLRDRLDPRFVR